MKFSTVTCCLFILFYCSILSSGIAEVFRERNKRSIIDNKLPSYWPSYERDLFDVHCYDVAGIKTVYDDCWNNPRTTDIVIRSRRDESSRVRSRKFSLYDVLGETDLAGGYSDSWNSNLLVPPTGFGLHCFDTTGVRIEYDGCWSSPKTRNILLAGIGPDTRINSRRFGATSTYYGGSSFVSYLDEVEDCYCVTQDRYYSDSRGILYVKMRPQYQFSPEIRTRLLNLNWAELDDCIPYDVVEVPYLPYLSYDTRLPY